MRVLICDDEPLAIERLRDLLARCDDVEVVGAASDGRAGIDAIAALRPDAVLIDIEMPRLDGFDVVEELARNEAGAATPPPLIVFVTAYPRFAAHAFDTGALDFLTKPVRLARLQTAIGRVRQALADRSARARLAELAGQLDALRAERAEPAETEAEHHLWVQRRGEIVRVDLDKVEWVRAEGEYVRLYCGAVSYLHRDQISAIAGRLDARRFVRVHRSHIVNRARVASVRRSAHGALKVLLHSGDAVPVGRSYRKEARSLIIGGNFTDV